MSAQHHAALLATALLERHRALRTNRTNALEREDQVGMDQFGTALDLYFVGYMETSIALGGQVMGRIDAVKPVDQILAETMREFAEVAGRLGTIVEPESASR